MAVALDRPATARPKARRRARINGETRAAMLFLLPATIGFVVFYAWPALRGFYLSFTNFDLLRNSGDWKHRAAELTHIAPPMTPGEYFDEVQTERWISG